MINTIEKGLTNKIELIHLLIHLRQVIDRTKPIIFWIDLFSGAGGTTTGIHMAGNPNMQVVACVNHDDVALQSHKYNNPHCIHMVEDVRNFEVVVQLKYLVDVLRKYFPGCLINIWSSSECTNYSKAKGGLPRDADSRTLPNTLIQRYDADNNEFYDGDSYMQILKPDYLYVENVEEFMSWGPLDDKGKPISKFNGIYYLRWVKNIQNLTYDYDYKFLNAADYGGYQSRDRYFGIFSKRGMPVKWPKVTHAKNPVPGGLFEQLEKWKPVREVLDLDEEGESMFTNPRLRSEKTDIRILDGLEKFVPNHEETFLSHYYGNGFNTSVKTACPTIRTKDSVSKIDPVFLLDYQFKSKAHSIDEPCPTVTTKDKFSPVKLDFITNNYSGGGQLNSIDEPSSAVTTVPKQNITTAIFIDQQFGQSKTKSLCEPCGAITTNPKYDIVSAWIMDQSFNNIGSSIEQPVPTLLASRHYHYLMNPQFNSKGGSVDTPCFTLIARMDKRPPSLITTNKFSGNRVEIQWTRQKLHHPTYVLSDGTIIYYFSTKDNPTRRKIKWFMILHGIVDIKKRMLTIPELLRIQGFPGDYKLFGTLEMQKKHIGNAVHTIAACRLTESNYEALLQRVEVFDEVAETA